VAFTTVTGLYTLAQQLMVVAEDATALTSEGTPDRRYVSPASPPWDCCPFVAVHSPGLTEEITSPLVPVAATGQRSGSYGRLNLASLAVTVVRCAPHADPIPLPADVEAVASQVMQDGWALWNALGWAVKCGTFKDACADVHVDRGVSVSEQGMCVGWQFFIRAEIEGMENPGCGS